MWVFQSNTCSAEHKAILNANMHKEGYLASGVAAILCARHSLVRPNGVGDLQKGERYVLIDRSAAPLLTNHSQVLQYGLYRGSHPQGTRRHPTPCHFV